MDPEKDSGTGTLTGQILVRALLLLISKKEVIVKTRVGWLLVHGFRNLEDNKNKSYVLI